MLMSPFGTSAEEKKMLIEKIDHWINDELPKQLNIYRLNILAYESFIYKKNVLEEAKHMLNHEVTFNEFMYYVEHNRPVVYFYYPPVSNLYTEILAFRKKYEPSFKQEESYINPRRMAKVRAGNYSSFQTPMISNPGPRQAKGIPFPTDQL